MNKSIARRETAIAVDPEVARQALYMFVVSLYSFVAVVAITLNSVA